MSDDDIEKAVKEAAEFEAQDKKRKEAIDARNDADAFIFQTKKALDEVGDKVSDDEKASVQAEIDAVQAILDRNPEGTEMSDSDLDELKAAKEKLMNTAQGVFAKMYEQAQGAAGAQGAGPDMGQAAGNATDNAAGAEGFDDVVDADFKEV